MDILFDIVTCGVEIYILFDFGRCLLQLNHKNWILRMFIIGGFYLAYMGINSIGSSIVNLISVPILYIAFLTINFSDFFVKKFCVAISCYALVILPEFIFSVIVNVNSTFSYRIERNESLTLIIILIMKMITFVLVKFIARIHNKKQYEAEIDKTFISLLVLPVATIIFLSGLFYSDVHISSSISRGIILIGAMLLVFANMFMFYLFDSMILNMTKIQKLERLYIKSKLEKKYLEQLNKSDEEQKNLLHDINKYVTVAATCVATGDIEGAEIIFEKLSVKIHETRSQEFCKNKFVNVILTDRLQTFRDSNIEFIVKIEPDIDFSFIDDIDIIAILGNLLDNAYEATITCKGKRRVMINIFTENKGHFLIINIENNYNIFPISDGRKYETIKGDKKNHGIGIHTVEKIVNSYGGKLIIDNIEAEKIFNVTIIFQN